MEHISLSDLQKQIKTGIESRHESAYWVTAEINELKVNSAGHCYIELVQKSEKNDSIQAKISAVIWASMYRLLKSYFETSTGTYLDAGIKVLVKTYVQYHELYGLSLNIIDIDPSYTVGSIELQRQQTIARLQDEGVFDMNRSLDFPLLPQRIAVISSKQAAGYQDFMEHLSGNDYGYAFHAQLFAANMQGSDAEKSIVAALDAIYKQVNNFDVVVIIRGGGSQADLSCFDSYRIAYHAAQFPLPVLTGIGHDKDMSIADMVAYRMLKTPTAVADFLVDALLIQDTQLVDYAEQLDSMCNAAMNDEINKLNTYSLRIEATVQNQLLKAQMRLHEWLPKQIRMACQQLLRNSEHRLQQCEVRVEANNPQAVLQRGYSMVTYKGARLTSIKQVAEGELVDTYLADGKFTSQIKDIT